MGLSPAQRLEKISGRKEARVQIELLRKKWPLAFAEIPKEVIPLRLDASREIMAFMGWTRPYTDGVLSYWKNTMAYCKSILNHNYRYNLDGSTTEDVVCELARSRAREQLKAIKNYMQEKKKQIAQPESVPSKKEPKQKRGFLGRKRLPPKEMQH